MNRSISINCARFMLTHYLNLTGHSWYANGSSQCHIRSSAFINNRPNDGERTSSFSKTTFMRVGSSGDCHTNGSQNNINSSCNIQTHSTKRLSRLLNTGHLIAGPLESIHTIFETGHIITIMVSGKSSSHSGRCYDLDFRTLFHLKTELIRTSYRKRSLKTNGSGLKNGSSLSGNNNIRALQPPILFKALFIKRSGRLPLYGTMNRHLFNFELIEQSVKK